jgi:hypothetical protein
MIGEYVFKRLSGGKEPPVPSWVSLVVVAALLGISIAASAVAKRREARMMNDE